jgi:hypothetical protein
MRVWLTRMLTGFVPADDESGDVLSRFPLGTTFEAEVKTRRNRSTAWNARYWLLLARCVPHVTEVNIRELGDDGKPIMWPVNDSQSLHTAIKFMIGLCDKHVIEVDGATYIHRVPKSIAFDEMDFEEWAACWPRILDAIHQRVLPGYVDEDLARLAS